MSEMRNPMSTYIYKYNVAHQRRSLINASGGYLDTVHYFPESSLSSEIPGGYSREYIVGSLDGDILNIASTFRTYWAAETSE